MDGVILYADDHIFRDGVFVNQLFHKFNSTGNFSIIPINNLGVLEKTVSSISTYKAIILDWNFEKELEEDDKDLGLSIPEETPYDFLKNNKIYSLIYVYSQKDIDPGTVAELEALYPRKIFFNKKTTTNEIEVEYKKISEDIIKFEEDNLHLQVPYAWSQAINSAAQAIFSELESADKYWIKELFYSSVRKFDKKTGEPKEVEIEPTIEVITLFQNILSERLIQNSTLRDSIYLYSTSNFTQDTEQAEIVNLYSRLYYTKTLLTDAVMTGDVYKLSDDCFGVIISPECDMMKLIKKNESVELLCFSKNSFNVISDFCKTDDEIKRAYNQEIAAFHLLPIFPFTNTDNKTALVDFRFSLKLVKAQYLEKNKGNRTIKINTPYIQQLRQRYLAYVGRVGVPAIPSSLRSSEL